MEINVRIILSNKNTPFPNTFWSDLESTKDLLKKYSIDSQNVLNHSDPKYISIIYAVKCYDKNWHLKQVVLYKDCLKTKKDMDCIQIIKEHYGYKNFIILAHHKKQ